MQIKQSKDRGQKDSLTLVMQKHEQQKQLIAKQISERERAEAAREQALREEQLRENKRAKQIMERERAVVEQQREKALHEKVIRDQELRNKLSIDKISTTNGTVATSSNDYYCRLTQSSGTCQSYQDQWYFDFYSGRCLKFIYTGCGGNLNRFSLEAECLRRCGHLKLLSG